jgi:hypothetical protein
MKSSNIRHSLLIFWICKMWSFPSTLFEFDMVDTLTHDGLKTCVLLILYGSTSVQLITIHNGDQYLH